MPVFSPPSHGSNKDSSGESAESDDEENKSVDNKGGRGNVEPDEKSEAFNVQFIIIIFRF